MKPNSQTHGTANEQIWSALAERSGDSALAGRSPIQSGVALRLPRHSRWPRMVHVPVCDPFCPACRLHPVSFRFKLLE